MYHKVSAEDGFGLQEHLLPESPLQHSHYTGLYKTSLFRVSTDFHLSISRDRSRQWRAELWKASPKGWWGVCVPVSPRGCCHTHTSVQTRKENKFTSDCKMFPWISHAAAPLWSILTQSTTFSSLNPNISANSRTHETMSLFRAAPVLIICTLTRAPSYTGSLFLRGGQLLGVPLHYLTANIHYTSRNLINFRLLL